MKRIRVLVILQQQFTNQPTNQPNESLTNCANCALTSKQARGLNAAVAYFISKTRCAHNKLPNQNLHPLWGGERESGGTAGERVSSLVQPQTYGQVLVQEVPSFYNPLHHWKLKSQCLETASFPKKKKNTQQSTSHKWWRICLEK